MPSQDKILAATGVLEPKKVLKLLNRIGQAIRDAKDIRNLTTSTATLLGTELSVERCAIMLTDENDGDGHLIVFRITAEFNAPGVEPLGERRYQLKAHCELNRLLQEGKPIPLGDIAPSDYSALQADSLERLVTDSKSRSMVVFPLVSCEKVLGLISLHQSTAGAGFCEEILELGEAVSDELVMSVERLRASSNADYEGILFRNISMPAMILDAGGRIKRYNQFCPKTFPVGRKDWSGISLLEIIPDSQRILESLRQLSKTKSSISLSNVLISHTDSKSVYMDACLSFVSAGEILLLLHSVAERQKTGEHGRAAETQHSDELASNFSRQLSWERWVRQIICKLHSTLDRDTLLQTVVDGFGRALGASRCLIVRTDTQALPMVTHEYAEPDISPLGLGRTGQFPTAATSYFKHKAAAIGDLAELERSGELSADEYEYFADNGIRSMAGAPISAHGIKYGVIIILESGSGRKWTAHELDMLEIAATQTAVALGHSQQYLQIKDQLFNMNLLGNLTQQLTNTLELVSRGGGKAEQQEEKRLSGNLPPLSLRELEVLKLIASGLANREIAQRLFLTESTVELHASRIRKKLKLKSRTALVKYACDNGLA